MFRFCDFVSFYQTRHFNILGPILHNIIVQRVNHNAKGYFPPQNVFEEVIITMTGEFYATGIFFIFGWQQFVDSKIHTVCAFVMNDFFTANFSPQKQRVVHYTQCMIKKLFDVKK